MTQASGRQRMLEYLQQHVGEWVHNQDLRNYAGINDVPRNIRAFKQQGWQIEVDGQGNNRLLSLEQGPARGRREGISGKLRFEVLTASDYRCAYCGRGIEDGVKLVVDHVVPVNWGGANTFENLKAACQECNGGKQAWVSSLSSDKLKDIMSLGSVEQRIEALFDAFPNQDIPSTMIQLVSRNAFDWQRALRRVRGRTGKQINPLPSRRGYRYDK